MSPRVPENVQWMDACCTFDCPCGMKDLFLHIDQDPDDPRLRCRCGRRYKLLVGVTVDESMLIAKME